MPHTTRIRTPEERMTFRRRCLRGAAVTGILALGATAFIGGPALAAHGDVSLVGSDFEIDTDANLKVDHADPPSLDWANVTEARQADLESGTGDDSFGQGSKEDTPVPTVVSGSIPPNKSDLKTFGTYLEETPGGDFLHMFWHRVQDPTGTTNMDFEFNQSDVLSANGVTPVRTDGDLLIQYDLANGGTNPELFLSRWVASGPKSQCEAANSTPCWGARVNLSAAGDATGSINTSAIPAADADGLGDISPRTFGEASVDFSAIVGDGCVTFGSAYLKSRSSDSFTAAMKDFIAPLDTGIDSCAQVIIRKVTDPNPDPSDSTFSYTTSNFVTPTETDPTFDLKNGESQDYSQVFIGTGLTVTEDLAALPAGWKLDSIDCSASSGVTPLTDVATGTITFDLDENSDVVDCTYYNETGGTVIVRKVTDPDPDPSDASFGYSTVLDTLTNGTDPSFSLGNGDSQTYDDVLLGTGYTITEDSLPTGWAFEDLDCSASSGVSPNIVGATVTFDIDDASDVLDCTYGNQTGGTVIVRKATQPSPDESDTSFDYSTAFSTLSGATDPTFSLKDGEQQTYSDVLFGTGLTVAEDALPAGWELIDVDCSASSGVTPVVVDEVVTFTIDDADDVLDCTYTNRAFGSIVVEKITDSGSGSFEFTSTTLSPSPFTLTTSGAGAAGKDSKTFSNLDPGTYDVAETIPDYWNLVSATCDDGSDPASIGLSAGEDVTCTFHDEREVGAIEITKLRKHAADGLGVNHPHEGVDFVITGGELPAEGITVTTDANGVACATGLLVSGLAGMYTIEEAVPGGYAEVGTQTANVTEAADCANANAGAVKEFVNTPLTDITVSVDSQVPGGTFSSIECDVAGSDSVSIADAIDDPSITITDLEPRTVVCTIVIDP
ncbi:prealbumin-like fold domain-containing protein [Agromyces sp. SYSU T00266]|uniref:prealbumin-like fold domain-containing protein n=1 Tax=Agromyces zhanjiangensis TaxID=3158562 RepID=UPI00339AA67A